MKIRKKSLDGKEYTVFIYENKKEECTVIAIPSIEWSIILTFDEGHEEVLDKVSKSLERVVSANIAELAESIYQWSREM
ncbi:hypothetical protein J9303_02695 [Bacillaceae bacterium Marseille-Q3522]|nr:hypothetical protein [Bacillaceae bacterium Marseille-Q3522]